MTSERRPYRVTVRPLTMVPLTFSAAAALRGVTLRGVQPWRIWRGGARNVEAFVVVASIAGASGASSAATLYVPGTVPTVEQAVAIAEPFDEIVVAGGSYSILSTLVLDKSDVLVRSAIHRGALLVNQSASSPLFQISADRCEVRGFYLWASSARVIDVQSTASESVIDGNVIDGAGWAPGIVDYGAGSTIRNNDITRCSSPIHVFLNGGSVIENNAVHENAKGISISAPATVRWNTIVRHKAGFDYGESLLGAGVTVAHVVGVVRIEHNRIEENWASGSLAPPEAEIIGSGGGVYCVQSSNVVVSGNEFLRNQALLGGGLYAEDSNLDVSENVFYGNQDSTYYESNPTRGEGGGILLVRCTGSVAGNTVVDNRAAFGGGGVDIVDSATLVINNNVVCSNWSEDDASGIRWADGPGTIECNDVWNNQGGNYGGVGDQSGQNGNIDSDPLFCDVADGVLSLRSDSPCAEYNAPIGCGRIGAAAVGCWVPAGAADASALGDGLAWRAVPNPVVAGLADVRIAGVGSGSLVIYDARGREVRRIGIQSAGEWMQEWRWDLRDYSGRVVPGGIYFVRMDGAAGVTRVTVVR